jgi:hypothetical protein
MKIILASPRGFCAGVNMAIETLERSIALFGAPVYVYHEIVHNKHVVERFRGEGAIFVDDLHDVPEGGNLLFSAHGVSPEVRQVAGERRLKTIDATCPLVTKVHLEAVRYAKLGYTIILVGHAGHDEVIGTMGEAPAAFLQSWPISRKPRFRWTMPTGLFAVCNSGFLASSVRRRKTFVTPLRTGKKPCDCWRRRPILCSSSAARTARTVCDWLNWPRRRVPAPI